MEIFVVLYKIEIWCFVSNMKEVVELAKMQINENDND